MPPKKPKLNISILGENSASLCLEDMDINFMLRDYNPETIMDDFPALPDAIICMDPLGLMGEMEIAQALRMNFSEAVIIFASSNRANFNKRLLVKNGFTDAFLLPWEKSELKLILKNIALTLQFPELKDYTAIKVVDIQPGSVLNFSTKILLPINNLLVDFSQEDTPVSEEKLKKLEESKLNTLLIHKDDEEKFRSYTAKTLKTISQNKTMSETERKDKLRTCVRDLIADLFVDDASTNTFGKSHGLLDEIKKIIKLIIVDNDKQLEAKLNLLINEQHGYHQHHTNVSAFAGFFAYSLGLENPEHIALAGLVHDIGKTSLPAEFMDSEEEDLQGDSLEAFKKHPEFTLEVLRMKRMVIPDAASKAILQHHEKVNGKGYPKGYVMGRIAPEARVLAIADRFDHLTSFHKGRKPISAKSAFELMIDENSKEPENMSLDLDMLKSLKTNLIK